jgi:hypothetical protein
VDLCTFKIEGTWRICLQRQYLLFLKYHYKKLSFQNCLRHVMVKKFIIIVLKSNSGVIRGKARVTIQDSGHESRSRSHKIKMIIIKFLKSNLGFE